VIKDAAEIERLAARATFQLGMCYLKKGDKDKAAEYFQKVVSDYPSQKELVTKSQKQLEQTGATTASQGVFVINTVPDALANDVDPGLDKITVTFNTVMMDGSWSWTGGGETYPQTTGEHYYDEAKMTCTKPVKLEPGKVYWVGINSPSHNNFKTPDRKPAKRYVILFATKNTDGKPTPIPDDLLKQAKAINAASERAVKQLEKLTPAGAKSASVKPLKLESAPWVDGEIMELRLIRPTGKEYGAIIYSAQSDIADAKTIWQIVSHMFVKEGNVSQFTLVKAQADSFVPVYGQTTNWMGNFAAEYGQGNVKLSTNGNTHDIPVSNAVYDNEQALYLIRRMPLAQNYEGCFPIFPVQGGGATVECWIKVLAVEDITVAAGTFKCFKTDLSIYAGQIKSLQHTLWFSADEHKYLVKYDVGGAGVMELESVRQKAKDAPMIFENALPAFSVAVPSDWRFYSYQSPGPQYSLQMLPPDIKAWAVLVWQKRGDDPDSASAATISKADSEKIKGKFKNYLIRPDSNKDVTINGCQAAQYIADYQEDGSGLQKYDKPKEMVEYRTYLVDKTEVYWFVFRVEKEKFNDQKPTFDSIVKSFEKKQ